MLLVVWWAWNYTTWVTNELDPDSTAVRLAADRDHAREPADGGRDPRGVRRPRRCCSPARTSRSRSVATRSSPSWRPTRHDRAGARRRGSSSGSPPRACCGSPAAFADEPTRTALWLRRARDRLRGAARRSTGSRDARGSTSTTWEVETSHFAERFQLFIIIALGETIVITGATTAELELDRGAARRVRARVPRDRGAVVAVLQLRRADRAAAARARARPHAARARRLHVPPRRAGRGHDRRRGRRRAGDRAPDRGAAGRGGRRRRGGAGRSTCSGTSSSGCGWRARRAGSASPGRSPASRSGARRAVRARRSCSRRCCVAILVAVIAAEHLAAAPPRARGEPSPLERLEASTAGRAEERIMVSEGHLRIRSGSSS